MFTLTIHVLGKSIVREFDTLAAADCGVRQSARKYGFDVLPATTDSGEDAGRGKVIRVRNGQSVGHYSIV